ncbi:MAG: 16S rRNA (cytidine(1402)-2'-O)-methyltransferase [Candidatus Marinimicrobia bacterium]|nr:16S rRNA (cytidine(1402)-2'-O)-methyltransferase [Candidatus Neomarinimicrobiota bacterium]MCF7840364.1 16S rRNA (cytidine(1402)-2'-O)-methyltransferase [Candidatus Neomarinimicrobiota bacterium]
MTYRGVEILKSVALIGAEDTRTSRRLLDHYQIKTPLLSYHDFNKEHVTPRLLEKLAAGDDLALITDAGTPMVSDPGFFLTRAAIAAGIEVVPIPGASALLAAIVGAGLPTDRFVFEGFLPRKKGRQTRLKQLAADPRTLVIYESPQRIEKTLRDIRAAWGNRPVVIARELTKKFEEFIRGELNDVMQKLEGKTLKGEIVLIIGGKLDR